MFYKRSQADRRREMVLMQLEHDERAHKQIVLDQIYATKVKAKDRARLQQEREKFKK